MTGLFIFTAYSIALGSIFYYLQQPYNRDWWLKITTAKPFCVYYFGPFNSKKEAQENLGGYREDLEAEEAKILKIQINQSLPSNSLTFCPEEI
ncbi:MAG: DUF1816 domain-containing protein [Limnothrix sp. RL_2_0]|nr:DUF1816 domain-containing protein [Limnothrix sp. RL_2_0]